VCCLPITKPEYLAGSARQWICACIGSARGGGRVSLPDPDRRRPRIDCRKAAASSQAIVFAQYSGWPGGMCEIEWTAHCSLNDLWRIPMKIRSSPGERYTTRPTRAPVAELPGNRVIGRSHWIKYGAVECLFAEGEELAFQRGWRASPIPRRPSAWLAGPARLMNVQPSLVPRPRCSYRVQPDFSLLS
jgi:hypothetical protein